MTSRKAQGQPLWIGTSWKMTKTLAQARDYARALTAVDWSKTPGVQPFVIPPATALAAVHEILGDGPVLLGAQNAHWEDAGAWTGEVSVPQVKDAGACLLEIGHSERRQHFAETDHTVNLKVQAALRHGLLPLICVGEPAQVRAAGGAVEHVVAQAERALAGVTEPVLLAYEPIWAIGSTGRPAERRDIAPVIEALHAELGDRLRAVLYGGSASPDNAGGLLTVGGVGGLFIGRAAWTPAGYLDLLTIAASHSEEGNLGHR